ncbi:sulfite exporter TauE/SafE family protein [Sphingomonas sp. HDW15A]|uniref:sulfite exporter TauE/SafE family protein n=1 Tax=Sphingomonas sp. HDW15A TaxID=2714942 RepID=UPI0019D15748|nr:sulfite exporter TauE/SafE family protein [Sphingomonas sp. HDW15A]
MDATTAALIALLMFFAAALYSTVGHGGASAYLAIMALFGVAPETMRPTALALNLVVAAFASWRYWRAGKTDTRLLLLFAATAVPAAFIGGGIKVPDEIYRPMVGAILWIAAIRLFWQPRQLAHREVSPVSAGVALPLGAVLGLLAGLTGTGEAFSLVL